MELLSQRLTGKQIAQRLGVTINAVHSNLVNICHKLGVHTRGQAVRVFFGRLEDPAND
jgi:DNA-binding CsgD family transcriptional regulator